MKEIRILGLHITDKVTEVFKVQDTLTKYGCSIKTRLGLNEAEDNYCTSNGIIILELCGSTIEMDKLENELLKLKGLVVKKMSF